MEECTVCVSYVFEIREHPGQAIASGWKDHIETAHRGAVVALRAAEAIVELVQRLDDAKAALGG